MNYRCRRSRNVRGVGNGMKSSGSCGYRLRPELRSLSSAFGISKRSSNRTRRTPLARLRAIHRRRPSVQASRRRGANQADSPVIRVIRALVFPLRESTKLWTIGPPHVSVAKRRCRKLPNLMIPNRCGIKWRKYRWRRRWLRSIRGMGVVVPLAAIAPGRRFRRTFWRTDLE